MARNVCVTAWPADRETVKWEEEDGMIGDCM